jgi:Oxidoreductase molybdopterin binding domain
MYNRKIMRNSESPLAMRRRTILQTFGLVATAGIAGGCDAIGGVFGRMFAVPPRDTTYFTPNSKFYVVNYADGAVSASRDLNIEQWKLHIKGSVQTPMSLGWRDILNRDSYDQISTLMCIDTLPGGDSMGTATWRGISLKKLLLDCGADTETARDVVFRGIDGYDDSIPFTRAMQDDVMLAFSDERREVAEGAWVSTPPSCTGTLRYQECEVDRRD